MLFVMSNSELVLAREEDPEEVGFKILGRTAALQDMVTGERSVGEGCDVVVVKRASDDEENEKSSRRPSLGDLSATDDLDVENGDGFRTPTSSDDRIKVPRKCPRAPRKPKPVRLPFSSSSSSSTAKRKASGSDMSQHLDLSREVEALFPPSLLADFHRKIKKARR